MVMMALRQITRSSPTIKGRLTGLSGELLGRRFDLEKQLVVGRGGEVDIILADPRVSREHARITKLEDGTVEIEDLGSRNGTTVNGVKVKRVQLKVGDRIGIGAATFLYARRDELGEEIFSRNRMQTIGQLAVGLAHDLNNALCVVQAAAGVLQDIGDLSPGERDECLADVLSGSQRAASLAKRLLSYARGHDGRAEEIDLRQAVGEAVGLLKRALPRTIAIRAELATGVRIFADPLQLHQLIYNLALNARDAIEESGRDGSILVTTKVVGDEAELSITDDGCGMSEEVRSRIFEPFFTSKPDGRGHGVGLATVAEIVKTHGGTMEVKSILGMGTTFQIRFPSIKARPWPIRRTEMSQLRLEPRSGAGRLALVVEPQKGVRDAVARSLRRAGYLVEDCEDPRSAAEKLRGRAPTLVLIDLDEAGRDLRGFIGELRAADEKVALVGLSATGGEGILAEARALGVPALLLKPFSHLELLETVALAVLARDGVDLDTTVQLEVD